MVVLSDLGFDVLLGLRNRLEQLLVLSGCSAHTLLHCRTKHRNEHC